MSKYFMDHWNGVHPLWKAYWVNMIVLSMVAGLLVGMGLGFTVGLLGIRLTAQGWLLLCEIATLPITIWGMVGSWRSATTYNLSHTGFWCWGKVTKVVIVIGILRIAARILV
jgi:hypothetical protein